jgi:hypothetical protein
VNVSTVFRPHPTAHFQKEELMLRSRRMVLILTAVLAATLLHGSGASAGKPKSAGYAPHIDPAEFVARVDNPWFPLVPGTRFVFHETKDGKTAVNEVTVLSDTKVLMGVNCTVVHDVVKDGDTVKEDTYDWYAQDKQGNVWYFGEDTREFLPGGRINTEGSWQAGAARNQPGIIMPGKPVPGAPYRQEYGPGHAEDMGQVVAVNDSVKVPYGSFGGCVRTKEWSLLEAGTDRKWYAKGVGFIREEAADKAVVTLVSVTLP